jgi:hypothetical protein
MDLGNSGNICFFTDTLFRDANTNNIYDQGEGVAGVSVTLVVGGILYGSFDISTPVGSFAIPIQSIAANALVQVVVSNTSAASIIMSIPGDYRAYTTVALAPAEGRVAGTFNKPTQARNIGFRDLIPLGPPLAPPHLAIAASGTNLLLTWMSETSLQYLPQRTTNFLVWTDLTTGYQTGTGSNIVWPASPAGGNRSFYRLLVRRP